MAALTSRHFAAAARALAAVACFSLGACSSSPKQEPYQYRDLPEQPSDFISAPQDPREAQGDPAAAAAQWAIYTDKTGATTKQPHISGMCLLRDGNSDLPCVGVTFVLLDTSGNEIGRQMTHRSGRFVFVVDPGKKYSIQPLSTEYSSEFNQPSPFSAGDHVRIHLEVK